MSQTWNVTDTNGSLSGSGSYTGACGVQETFSIAGPSGTGTGTYTPSNQAYSLTGTSFSVPSYYCAGYTYHANNLVLSGSLAANSCGLGTGKLIDGDDPNTSSFTTERIPAAEISAGANPAWGDSIGAQATAIFNVTLSAAANGPAYNFGGRRVQELIPTPAQTPAGSQGKDGCIWNDAPWTTSITSLAAQNIWNVQSGTSTAPNGSYGPDYIGLTNAAWVPYVQAYSPILKASPYSCTIQYPQLMVINQESVAYDSNHKVSPNSETCGGQGTGLNLIQFTITPTAFTVNRGTASASRTYHF